MIAQGLVQQPDWDRYADGIARGSSSLDNDDIAVTTSVSACFSRSISLFRKESFSRFRMAPFVEAYYLLHWQCDLIASFKALVAIVVSISPFSTRWSETVACSATPVVRIRASLWSPMTLNHRSLVVLLKMAEHVRVSDTPVVVLKSVLLRQMITQSILHNSFLSLKFY